MTVDVLVERHRPSVGANSSQQTREPDRRVGVPGRRRLNSSPAGHPARPRTSPVTAPVAVSTWTTIANRSFWCLVFVTLATMRLPARATILPA
jgi:hypothetical protein